MIGQQPGTKVNAGGQVEDGYTVLFTTGKGFTGSVFVPLAQFNPTHVQSEIAALAAQMDAIADLSSGG